MKSNYLFYFCDGIGSVFDSQVLCLLNAVHESNMFKKIFLFLGFRNENQKKDLLTRKVSLEIEIIFIRSYPNYPFFNYFNRKSIYTALQKQSINFKEVIFHTRGEITAWHLTKILKEEYHKQIIPDVRGAGVEEIDEFYDFNKLLKILKIRNIKKSINNLKRFNKISVVSASLKEYLVNNYKIERNKIIIIPCLSGINFRLNELAREQIRKELKLSDKDLLVVYSSGGSANWQNDSILTTLADKGLKVLNLSRKNIQHKNIFNKFTDYSEIPDYLSAADYAIIWRNRSTVNKVASPVKFSEFVCCGLPVIANYSVDMINEYLTKHNCGLLTDSIVNLEMSALNDLKQKDRKKISESGNLNFGVKTITGQYIQLYTEIDELNNLSSQFY